MKLKLSKILVRIAFKFVPDDKKKAEVLKTLIEYLERKILK